MSEFQILPKINRRTLLRGAGFALGLPLLEAMTPMSHSIFASDETVHSPVRMACVFFPNGAIMKDWKPESPSNDSTRQWQLSRSLQPLERMKSKINVISGLTHNHGRSNGDGAGDHARCAATFLTAARPTKTSTNIHVGISVDQVAAAQLSGKTRLPSIELGLVASRNAGSCDSGYSCAYSSNISWRNEKQPMPKEITPRLAFDRMFGSGDLAQRRERNLVRKSILDVVRGDAAKIMKHVGGSDRRKLDEYFNSIREIEKRIEQSETEDRIAMPDLDIPDGRVESFREHARLMFDLMVVGFQTDATRVATLMLDNAAGSRRYTELGIRDAHHSMSHHRNRIETVAKLQKIDQYLVEQFAYFVERMDATKDAGGTLLDQSMLLYGSGISDGNRHEHHDLPIVLGGGARGQIETGRYIVTDDETPMGNLFLSMLDKMGTPAESIGDSSGRLQQLG